MKEIAATFSQMSEKLLATASKAGENAAATAASAAVADQEQPKKKKKKDPNQPKFVIFYDTHVCCHPFCIK